MHPSPYRPADFYLPCSPCRFQPASACPALPAASSRHLPSLLFLPLPAGILLSLLFVPFRPAPPGPAQPAVPPGTDLTWSSRRPAGICPPGQPPFRRYLTLLLILPLPAGICSPAPRAVPPAPDLHIPPLRRYLPGQRSLPFQPVPDSPAPTAGFSWFLTFTTHPAFNKLYLKLLSCVCLCVWVQIQT